MTKEEKHDRGASHDNQAREEEAPRQIDTSQSQPQLEEILSMGTKEEHVPPLASAPSRDQPSTRHDCIGLGSTDLLDRSTQMTSAEESQYPGQSRQLKRVSTFGYFATLQENAQSTLASKRLLEIMKQESVAPASSLGLSLLDLVKDLQVGGAYYVPDGVKNVDRTEVEQTDEEEQSRKPEEGEKAGEEESVEEQQTREPATVLSKEEKDQVSQLKVALAPIENRLDDFAAMLNAIAEAVGIKLLEDEKVEQEPVSLPIGWSSDPLLTIDTSASSLSLEPWAVDDKPDDTEEPANIPNATEGDGGALPGEELATTNERGGLNNNHTPPKSLKEILNDAQDLLKQTDTADTTRESPYWPREALAWRSPEPCAALSTTSLEPAALPA